MVVVVSKTTLYDYRGAGWAFVRLPSSTLVSSSAYHRLASVEVAQIESTWGSGQELGFVVSAKKFGLLCNQMHRVRNSACELLA